MSKKRVHYGISKIAIQEAIDAYNNYTEHMFEGGVSYLIWSEFYNILDRICVCNNVKVAIPSLLQAMRFSNTLDVEHVYHAILAAGINTQLEEVTDE